MTDKTRAAQPLTHVGKTDDKPGTGNPPVPELLDDTPPPREDAFDKARKQDKPS